ncbi:MAG: hypothetical protein H7Y20_13450 [Bryobacteraceae bacterium]|nr:hypothetical protein [Bryobacteraceae bacterium]
MDLIKGQISEILAPDRVLVEIAFIGNYNRHGYPDFVQVRFTDLSPPYTKDVPEAEIVTTLNKHILGTQVSVQVRTRDQDGTLVGRLQLEAVRFRGKRKHV